MELDPLPQMTPNKKLKLTAYNRQMYAVGGQAWEIPISVIFLLHIITFFMPHYKLKLLPYINPWNMCF